MPEINTGNVELDSWARFLILMMTVGFGLWQNRQIMAKGPGAVRLVRIERKLDKHIKDVVLHRGPVEGVTGEKPVTD
jgi:hypothetical protein